ncbi:DNA mismatch repair protein mutl [Halogeometricum pallidum JCM 14848]|uniref:DNA mismatch repair protein MutL n=1 Tax=Halogeometricum pallidum JCM 14848 TaxID=1227487 RepID=M0DH97_HALPD|nr:DNA mismatch repair endonuclease MutL [Halogeometricum pallidum]ELZ34082.1 DNA mismatch repair protein mutl [Halogeometricum pallidum JCM 14848]
MTRETETEAEAGTGRVRPLDEETVASIAAGEVVTRPEDVVVELVENALDAGASRIEVTVVGDGTPLLRVRDDGRGMSEADAARAVDRHTTSKLGDADDLRTVSTLGFRGEALPSIAAAGTLELVTNDGGARGTRVLVDGEKRVEPAGRARGTTVEVRDLFAEMPARRRSLASSRAEFARVSDAVSRYALARPDVAFSLVHEAAEADESGGGASDGRRGREVFCTSGSGDYADAVLGVYDRDVAGRSTTFESERTVEDDGESATVRVEGLLAHPSVTRARRDHVYTAVNGRAFPSEALRRAVVAGYGDLLPDGRAPVAVVSVSLPAHWCDHNVHPAKREVRLRAHRAVERAVRESVRDALSTADLRRSEEVAMDLDSTLEPVDGEASRFDDVRVIGQFRELYLLCEADDDLLVIDQHAAHERVNYERLRAARDGEDGDSEPSVSADVDPPAAVSLSPAQAAAADEWRAELAHLGFAVDPFGGGTVRVSAVPAPMGRAAAPESVRDALDALRGGETPGDATDRLLKDLACHPSLKAGDGLSSAEATRLVERLGACETPYACPHGRPTVLSIEEETFVRGFERRSTRMD